MKILIVGSLYDVELKALVDTMKSKTTTQDPLATFYEGILFNKPVVVCQTKVGLLYTAAAVTYAIGKYKPDMVLDIGCSNGYLNMEQGNIVVGLTSINLTSIKTEYRKQGEGSNPEKWTLVNYLYGEREKIKEQKGSEELINKFKDFVFMNSIKNVAYGVIGSGDIINKEHDRVEYLADNYNVLCEDMSAVSTYSICNELGIKHIGIKIVSGNEANGVLSQREQGLKLQPVILKFLEYIN